MVTFSEGQKAGPSLERAQWTLAVWFWPVLSASVSWQLREPAPAAGASKVMVIQYSLPLWKGGGGMCTGQRVGRWPWTRPPWLGPERSHLWSPGGEEQL